MNRIYLDYNATAPCRPEVAARTAEVLASVVGNPSSLHAEGRGARTVVDEARAQVAEAIGARPEEIVFTSGGTESDNLAIAGILRATTAEHPHVVTSNIEHHAVLYTCRTLESQGIRVSFAGCDAAGRVSAATVGELLDDETALVSIMHSNNEVGTLQPVPEIAALARARGIPVHTDAVQSLGRVPLEVNELGVDLLSLSGHKVGGPKGVGVLYVRDGTALRRLMQGGHQERDRRPGTENVAAIAGMGLAVQLAASEQAGERPRLQTLKGQFCEGLRATIEGVEFNGTLEDSLPNTVSVAFPDVKNDEVLPALDQAGISASTGSACAMGERSHVLAAMCLAESRCTSTIRFSLGYATTAEEIREAVARIGDVVNRLRCGPDCCCHATDRQR